MFPEGFITTDRIRTEVSAGSKKRALETIATLLGESEAGDNTTAVFDRLLERERLGSTGMGRGIALPHARVPGITEARGAFIRLSSPIDFDAVDNEPVDLIFGFLAPENATDEHLQLLAGLAALFGDPDICSTLRSAPDGDGILLTLTRNMADAGIHGVLISVFDHGLLITGAHGAGKSELALGLVDRGHQLVADDCPILERREGELIGRSPEAYRGCLHVHGIGIVDIFRLFGEKAVRRETTVHLCIRLTGKAAILKNDELLHGEWGQLHIHRVDIPMLTLCSSANRNLPLLVETAVHQRCNLHTTT